MPFYLERLFIIVWLYDEMHKYAFDYVFKMVYSIRNPILI